MANELLKALLEELVKLIAPNIKAEIKDAIENSLSAYFSSQEQKILSRKEAAHYLKYTTTTLHIWEKKGMLKPDRIGRKCFYPKSRLDAFLQGKQASRNSIL